MKYPLQCMGFIFISKDQHEEILHDVQAAIGKVQA